MPEADMLGKLQNQLHDSFQTVQQAKPTHPDGSPIENPEEIRQYWQNLAAQGVDISQFGITVEDLADKQMDASKEMSGLAPQAGRILFDLKTAQMAPPMDPSMGGMPPAPAPAPAPQQTVPGEEDPFAPAVSIESAQFNSPQDVFEALDAVGNVSDAIEQFTDRFSHDNAILEDPDAPQRKSDMSTAIEEPIKDFFQSNNKDEKLQIAEFIYHKVIRSGDQDGDNVPTNHVENVKPHVASIVKSTNEIIRRMAEQDAKNVKTAGGVWNLKKEAQHQSMDHNVIMYGPDDVVQPSWSKYPLSKWHLIERNKGFGLQLPGLLSVDFESAWRENVMDKYYPGYIEDRFEVDRSVPATNNYQLAEGETRRPTLPEYGNLGSRLEAERTKMNRERGYEPSSKGEVFNWKEASANKKKVEAQLSAPKSFGDGLKPLKFPGDEPVKAPSMKCPHCGKDLATDASGKVLETKCTCGQSLTAPAMGAPKIAPDKAKSNYQRNFQNNTPSIQPGTRLSSVSDEQISSFGGIFFDGSKFVCYADKKKHEFDKYEKAEEFMQMPSQNPLQMTMKSEDTQHPAMVGQLGEDEIDEVDVPVHPVQPMHPKKKEVATSAIGLAL